MAAVDIESVIKNGVERALNEPIMNGKSVMQWAEIGMTAPQVVRCKNCKNGEQCDPPDDDRYCVLYDQFHDMDWFCADGKVKEDG